ncbi:MAG: PAS domain-containing sensor histidine kinase [Gemmatimonadales bacterium]
MDVEVEQSTEEIKRLHRCIDDLVSVLALPAIWTGGEPSQIVRTLVDSLTGMLRLDLLYVRLNDPVGDPPIEMVRVAPSRRLPTRPQAVGLMLCQWLGDDPEHWPPMARTPVGDADLSLVPLRLGVGGDIGVLVAGCGRVGFPGQTEALLLGVAANQAAIGLREAWLRKEQQRVATELDRRVAQRTADLAAANEELRKSEAQLRAIINTIPALAWSTRPDGSSDFFNERWLSYTGLTAEQSLDFGWRMAVHPDDLARLQDNWRSVLVPGAPGERPMTPGREARLRRHDGEYRWFFFRGSPLHDESGRIVAWYGTNVDIEDRKRAEEALHSRERDLSLIIETMPGLVWCATPEGQLDYLNRRILDYTGSTLDAFTQCGWTHVLHPDDVEPVNGAWTQAVATGQTLEIQCRLRRSEGSYGWFHVLGQAARDSEGRVGRWYGLLIDIDDRKTIEEALRSSELRLSRAAQTAIAGEFAASVAHEINQPLSGIITNASTCLRMLAADPPNVDGALETARRTIRDGNRASDVITRLRALFRKQGTMTESVDLNEAAREVIALLVGELQSSRVVVHTKLADDLPPVTGDRVQLQQVILNLLRNASDAMSGVDDRPRQLVVSSERDEGELVRLTVRDSGVGFESRHVERLFDAFYTTKRDGMGIGLSVSRSIIESHQGRLWATPNDGPGASFSFSIPRGPERDAGLDMRKP